MFVIITFYEFKSIERRRLALLRSELRSLLAQCELKGTIILAEEGFNATIGGMAGNVNRFVAEFESLLETKLSVKQSVHHEIPFRKIDVKIKPEIVTLKKSVDRKNGVGTRVGAAEWNRLIEQEDVFVLDARNDYEYRNGTFTGAVNPCVEKFSDLPAYVEANLDPDRHQKVAMFCTGGIRCEKLAPYLKSRGFREVYELDGGILKYLEQMGDGESLWRGECFVFDGRRTVDVRLKQGSQPDYSNRNEKE